MKEKKMAVLRCLYVVVYFAFGLGIAAAHSAPPPKGAVVLTIAGNVGEANRGGIDKFADGFFNHHEQSFSKAFAFDRAMLAGLKQITVMARAEKWEKSIQFRGPLFKDVLARAKIRGKQLTVFALDGYGAELNLSVLDQQKWVLALEADGKPLGIGGRGPAWLVHETAKGHPANEDQESKWVWSVFLVQVK